MTGFNKSGIILFIDNATTGKKMPHAKYRIEVWKQGGLVCRTVESDSLEMTISAAQTLHDALGVTFTVFLCRDDVSYCSWEWSKLAES